MSEKRDIQYELKELQNTLTGPDSERAWDVVRCANDEITMLNMKYAALQQVSSAMAEALEAVEWVNDGPMMQYCPLCLRDRLDGHAEKCRIGIARTAFRTLEEKDK